MRMFDNMDEEDRFGLYLSGGVHLALIAFFILYSFSMSQEVRPSFVEVEFGEFQSGTQAEFAQVENEEVATQPNPSEVEPENPQPEEPEPVEEQQQTTDETTKQVDLADQDQQVQDEEVKTPDTDKTNPEETTAQTQQDEVVIPPKARQAEEQQQGAQTSGDTQGTTGDVDADQGVGNEQQKSSPFDLKIEGFTRDPINQPLPENTASYEATITLRFEVTPEGRVTNIIPIRKSGSPEIDREVVSTLNSWRFKPLPQGAPQQNQTGTITFRFVLD